MYRAGLAWLLAVTVLMGAANCSSSELGPDPAQEKAKVGTSVRPLEAKSCSSCLDIHLSDYNLFLLEDYSGGHVVEGKVAAGGNISMSKFVLGEKLSADNLHNAVVAGGTLTLTEGACKGDVYYKVDYVSEGVGNGCLTKQGSPISDFVAEFDKLRALSSRLAASPLQRQPTFEDDGMFVYFKGEDPCLNVFNVDASDLNRNKDRWSQWNFNVPAGSFVVVNIHGSRLDFGYVSTEFHNAITAKRVLYNFVDATLINGRNVNFQGTLLAPRAHVAIESGSLFGGLYAVSLNGGLNANYNPLDELAGGTEGAEETCNGVDDNCDGRVDEGFECTGSGSRSCTAWCGAAGTQSCNAATCGYGECVSSSCCRADTECKGGSYCEGTTCAAQKENGAACSGANQCASGQCVDGVCCNSACEGECDACNLAGQVGTCSMAPSTVQCRATGGECDVAESCTGSSAACPADTVVDAGTSCRAGSGICAVAEVCDGSSKACPLDGHVPNGTNCGTSSGEWGNCEGFSDYCDPTGTQSRAVTASSCEAGTCTPSSPILETKDCTREPPGPQPCPADSESWDACGGFSDTCDETGTQSHTKTTHRYNCDTGKCEATTVRNTVACTRSTAGVQCRNAVDACDVAESCQGGSCPADGKASTIKLCNDNNACTTDDRCNGAGLCRGTPPPPCPAPSESWGTCGEFSNTCDETGTQSYSRTTHSYNCATGKCEATTTNSTVSCTRSTTGDLCRGTAIACDVAEYCESGACPLDRKAPIGSPCGSGLVCTANNTCENPNECRIGGVTYTRGMTNPSAACQVCNPDVSTSSWSLKPANTLCRGSQGVCDVAEYCTGSSATCPGDAKKPAATPCRSATATCDDMPTASTCTGPCDVAESCTGSDNHCPLDGFAPKVLDCRNENGYEPPGTPCKGESSGAACNGSGSCVEFGWCNPLTDKSCYVRQTYHDVLNRNADPGGLAFWAGTLGSCDQNATGDACWHVRGNFVYDSIVVPDTSSRHPLLYNSNWNSCIYQKALIKSLYYDLLRRTEGGPNPIQGFEVRYWMSAIANDPATNNPDKFRRIVQGFMNSPPAREYENRLRYLR